MSNPETAPAVEVPVYNFPLIRNDVTLPPTAFKRLKGNKANTFYPSIQLTPDNEAEVFNWIGKTHLHNIVQKFLKSVGQTVAAEATNDEGYFDEGIFAKAFAEFSSVGMKLSEINDLIDELQATATRLIDQGSITIGGVVHEAFQIVDGRPKASEYLTKLNDDIRFYRQQREDKQRKPKADEDAVASVPA